MSPLPLESLAFACSGKVSNVAAFEVILLQYMVNQLIGYHLRVSFPDFLGLLANYERRSRIGHQYRFDITAAYINPESVNILILHLCILDKW